MLSALSLLVSLALAPAGPSGACSDCGRVMIPPLDPADSRYTACDICIYDFGHATDCFEFLDCGCGAFFPGSCTA